MCGRFTLTYRDRRALAEELGVPLDQIPEPDYRPRYNIAPTDAHWVVRMRYEERAVLPAKWGLVNSWAKDASRAAKQINARAETVRTAAAFRDAFEKRRCVVPADGFYEWIGSGNTKQPVWFHREDGKLIYFAGLYESWQPEPEQWQRTFTIITTQPNALVAPIHNRMPVVLPYDAVEQWLDPKETDWERVSGLLIPAAEDALISRLVSPKVNSVKNDDASLLQPVEQTHPLL